MRHICGTEARQRGSQEGGDAPLCSGCFPAGAGGYWFAGAEHPSSAGSQLGKLSRASKKENLQVYWAEWGLTSLDQGNKTTNCCDTGDSDAAALENNMAFVLKRDFQRGLEQDLAFLARRKVLISITNLSHPFKRTFQSRNQCFLLSLQPPPGRGWGKTSGASVLHRAKSH